MGALPSASPHRHALGALPSVGPHHTLPLGALPSVGPHSTPTLTYTLPLLWGLCPVWVPTLPLLLLIPYPPFGGSAQCGCPFYPYSHLYPTLPLGALPSVSAHSTPTLTYTLPSLWGLCPVWVPILPWGLCPVRVPILPQLLPSHLSTCL